ncbi:MAG: bifunctional precorrin-2 dehydrogenase/sirohydrochlorin ferrochelatase [Nitriliruptoraceae bacterium]
MPASLRWPVDRSRPARGNARNAVVAPLSGRAGATRSTRHNTVSCICRWQIGVQQGQLFPMTNDTAPTAPPTGRTFAFPVSLDVAGRRCVVAGAGPLAQEKAQALREAGADVVETPANAFDQRLLDDAFLLIVSGEDDTDPQQAFALAKQRGVLINILDDIPHCDFAFPSIVTRGPVKVAISTAGKAPALSRRVRLNLEEHLPDALGEVAEAYAQAREALLPRVEPFDVWAAAWRKALDDLDGLLELCARGHSKTAAAQITATVGEALGRDLPTETSHRTTRTQQVA